MSNKTLIPAFKSKVGDWNYYTCSMKYAEVARQISFAYELGGNKDLGTMIQRGLSNRAEAIKQYLIDSPHRFLGAMIVAVWGGDPQYVEVAMEDPEDLLKGLDSSFGLLTFDGSQQYFALDGQHRLKAIKDAIKEKPALGQEEICVLIVPHYDTDEGRKRTRRLFTNINRNAKTTTRAENIALDVDDGFAIMTRRFIEEHDFLSKSGVVRVFSRVGAEGELTLAAKSISKTDAKAFTTISTLYGLLNDLGFGLDTSMYQPGSEPGDEVLEASYTKLKERIDSLLIACGSIRSEMEKTSSARELRAPKGREEEGHAMMRPAVQMAVARVAKYCMDQDLLEWKDFLTRLQSLDWTIGEAPWTSVFEPSAAKMLTGKDNTDLLEELLRAHLVPTSKQQVARARKAYKDIRGKSYPVAAADLEKNLIAPK